MIPRCQTCGKTYPVFSLLADHIDDEHEETDDLPTEP